MSGALPTSAPLVPRVGASSTLLFGVVIVVALYLAREVLVPIALAILMSFVLAPPVRLLQAWRVPRVVAVLFVVLVSFGAIVAIGSIVAAQLNQLASDLPRYQFTLQEKIKSLRGATADGGTLEKAAAVLQDLDTELKGAARGDAASRSAADKVVRPIPVEIRAPDPTAMQSIAALIAPLINPLTTTGIVFLFAIFILVRREDLRNRLIRLAGVKDLQRTTAALDDAGQRLSQLFLTQLALNAGFGTVIGAGLFFIGVPSAPLWGILAMILRFMPYVGALISAVFPLVLAAAVGPGWTMVIWTALLFAIVELLTGHVVEPLATGRSSGLSPVAVIVSATFWTWLWGPIGLVLATPLTVCLVVIGRHVDRLKFLDVMFGDEPVLSPAELVYQRMLAGDAVEATDQAELYLKDKSVSAFYEEVLIPSLNHAHRDAERGHLDDQRLKRIRDTAAEIVHDLGSHEQKALAPPEGGPSSSLSALKEAERLTGPVDFQLPPAWQGETPVLCVPGHGPLDDTLALIATQLLKSRGIGARAESANAVAMSRIFTLETGGVALVCLCYLAGDRPAQVRYAVKRLRSRFPDVAIVVCLAGTEDSDWPADATLASPADVAVTHSLSLAVAEISASLRRAAAPPDRIAS